MRMRANGFSDEVKDSVGFLRKKTRFQRHRFLTETDLFREPIKNRQALRKVRARL